MRTLTYTVESEYDGAKVKDVLSKHFLISDRLCSKLKRTKDSIFLNGLSTYVTEKVHAGDFLSVAVGDFEKDPRIRPIHLRLEIMYEDPDLIVVNKPSNLAVHPSRDPREVTLENALAFYFGPDENPHPVSRLDKDTTGLMTVAKSGWSHSLMKNLQHAGQMQKSYLALVKGRPPLNAGVIDAPIGPFEGSTYQRIVRSDGDRSVSEYRVVASWDDLSLVCLIPHTGRTHQLRVHMAHIGCPLLGDWLYGERDNRIIRPALHSNLLSFRHPLTGVELSLSAPLPEDMIRLVPPSVLQNLCPDRSERML